jgi:hypothetical protein
MKYYHSEVFYHYLLKNFKKISTFEIKVVYLQTNLPCPYYVVAFDYEEVLTSGNHKKRCAVYGVES